MMNKEEIKEKIKAYYIANDIDKIIDYITNLQQENEQLKDKLSKIETLTINHNCDTGDIYYKYNAKYLKSEFKERLLEILKESESE